MGTDLGWAVDCDGEGEGGVGILATRAAVVEVAEVNSCLTGPLARAATEDDVGRETDGTQPRSGTDVFGCEALSTVAWLVINEASFRSGCKPR